MASTSSSGETGISLRRTDCMKLDVFQFFADLDRRSTRSRQRPTTLGGQHMDVSGVACIDGFGQDERNMNAQIT